MYVDIQAFHILKKGKNNFGAVLRLSSEGKKNDFFSIQMPTHKKVGFEIKGFLMLD